VSPEKKETITAARRELLEKVLSLLSRAKGPIELKGGGGGVVINRVPTNLHSERVRKKKSWEKNSLEVQALEQTGRSGSLQ